MPKMAAPKTNAGLRSAEKTTMMKHETEKKTRKGSRIYYSVGVVFNV